MTPLQAYVRALADVVVDARDELTPEQYSWFVAVACELLGIEAARLFIGEALRTTREDSEAA